MRLINVLIFLKESLSWGHAHRFQRSKSGSSDRLPCPRTRGNQTFLVPSGPDKHLYVVITEADDSGMHVLANVTSIDPDISHDKSCCLAVGDHPFIAHDSYVAYEFAMVRLGAHVDKRVQIGNYIRKEDASDALVEKMRVGLKKSPFTKRGIKDDFDKAVRAEEKRKKTAAQ